MKKKPTNSGDFTGANSKGIVNLNSSFKADSQ